MQSFINIIPFLLSWAALVYCSAHTLPSPSQKRFLSMYPVFVVKSICYWLTEKFSDIFPSAIQLSLFWFMMSTRLASYTAYPSVKWDQRQDFSHFSTGRLKRKSNRTLFTYLHIWCEWSSSFHYFPSLKLYTCRFLPISVIWQPIEVINSLYYPALFQALRNTLKTEEKIPELRNIKFKWAGTKHIQKKISKKILLCIFALKNASYIINYFFVIFFLSTSI